VTLSADVWSSPAKPQFPRAGPDSARADLKEIVVVGDGAEDAEFTLP